MDAADALALHLLDDLDEEGGPLASESDSEGLDDL